MTDELDFSFPGANDVNFKARAMRFLELQHLLAKHYNSDRTHESFLHSPLRLNDQDIKYLRILADADAAWPYQRVYDYTNILATNKDAFIKYLLQQQKLQNAVRFNTIDITDRAYSYKDFTCESRDVLQVTNEEFIKLVETHEQLIAQFNLDFQQYAAISLVENL